MESKCTASGIWWKAAFTIMKICLLYQKCGYCFVLFFRSMAVIFQYNPFQVVNRRLPSVLDTLVWIISICFHTYRSFNTTMGRPKGKIGRAKKNAEKKRQSLKKNSIGRPRKHKRACNPSTVSAHLLPGPATLEELRAIQLPSPDWFDVSPTPLDKIVFVKCSPDQPAVASCCLTIEADFTWKLYIHGQLLPSLKCRALSSFPLHLHSTALQNLLSTLSKLHLCAGWCLLDNQCRYIVSLHS